MADNNSDGEIIMMDKAPFYMTQPTEKLKKIFAHYLPLLKETLGEDLVSTHPIGSDACDILLSCYIYIYILPLLFKLFFRICFTKLNLLLIAVEVITDKGEM